jgi:transporter family protein
VNWLPWAILSAVFAGLTAILAKVGIARIDSNLATAIRTSFVVILTWGIVVCTRKLSGITEIERRTWIFLGLSAVATGLSWLCYFRALQLGEVSQVAPIDKLSVVIAIVLSMVFLGERLSVREGAGALLIVAGAVVIAWK